MLEVNIRRSGESKASFLGLRNLQSLEKMSRRHFGGAG